MSIEKGEDINIYIIILDCYIIVFTCLYDILIYFGALGMVNSVSYLNGMKIGVIKILFSANKDKLLIKTRTKCWVCECDCGCQMVLTSTDIRKIKEDEPCQCNKDLDQLITSTKYGKLRPVIKTIKERDRKSRYYTEYHCLCDCGGKINATSDELKNGSVTACLICRRKIKIKKNKK